MRYSTDIVGEVEIHPPLNQAETEYLSAFSASRRWWRPEGPYHVPDELREAESYDDIVLFNSPSPGEPNLRCHWVPVRGGAALAFDRQEKFYEPGPWLRYLIDHFLKPGARALSAGGFGFSEFSFDHILAGVLAAGCADTGRLSLFRVKDNRVREQVLVSGRRGTEVGSGPP